MALMGFEIVSPVFWKIRRASSVKVWPGAGDGRDRGWADSSPACGVRGAGDEGDGESRVGVEGSREEAEADAEGTTGDPGAEMVRIACSTFLVYQD